MLTYNVRYYVLKMTKSLKTSLKKRKTLLIQDEADNFVIKQSKTA